MKLIDLWNQVGKLVFNEHMDKDAFFVAANRAYTRVNRYDPIKRRIVLTHRVIRPCYRRHYAEHPSGAQIRLPVSGGYAFSVRVTGAGSLRITAQDDGTDVIGEVVPGMAKEVVQEIKWSFPDTGKGYHRITGFLLPLPGTGESPLRSPSAVFEFSGAYRYEIHELQIFPEVVSNRTADVVEYGEWVPYDLSEIVDDFFAFSEIPVRRGRGEEYVSPGCYLIRDSVLSLPSHTCGDYVIEYEKKLDRIVEPKGGDEWLNSAGERDKIKDEIEIDEELAQVLAYPIAAEIWLDYEPEKAAYYEDLFLRSISTVMAMRRNRENPIVITNGWEN